MLAVLSAWETQLQPVSMRQLGSQPSPAWSSACDLLHLWANFLQGTKTTCGPNQIVSIITLLSHRSRPLQSRKETNSKLKHCDHETSWNSCDFRFETKAMWDSEPSKLGYERLWQSRQNHAELKCCGAHPRVQRNPEAVSTDRYTETPRGCTSLPVSNDFTWAGHEEKLQSPVLNSNRRVKQQQSDHARRTEFGHNLQHRTNRLGPE